MSELEDYLGDDIVTVLAEYQTPTSVITGYIESPQSATYNGSIVGINNDGQNLTQMTGNFQLDITFAEPLLNVSITNMTHYNSATIDGGTVNSVGFTASGVSGDFVGKFYGANGSVIGGTVNLNEGSGSMQNTFAGTFIGSGGLTSGGLNPGGP